MHLPKCPIDSFLIASSLSSPYEVAPWIGRKRCLLVTYSRFFGISSGHGEVRLGQFILQCLAHQNLPFVMRKHLQLLVALLQSKQCRFSSTNGVAVHWTWFDDRPSCVTNCSLHVRVSLDAIDSVMACVRIPSESVSASRLAAGTQTALGFAVGFAVHSRKACHPKKRASLGVLRRPCIEVLRADWRVFKSS
jgi:hypothetical protein